MQVTETQNEGLKRGYQFTLTGKALAEVVDQKLAEARPEVEIKGFRKGKVPMAMLRKQFGQRIMGDAMQEAIDGTLRKHLEETGHRPATQPQIQMADAENWKEGDDLMVNVEYEVLPEIPETDFSGIELERLVVEADEASVTEAVANLAKSAITFNRRGKNRKVSKGDQVTIDFKGTVDGEAFEGGTAEAYPLVIGSASFIPGFEDQLIGSKTDDVIEVKVTFPEDYGAAHLAGKDAIFETVIKAVAIPEAAEINDELAKRYGADDLEALKAQMAERLGAEYGNAARAIVKRRLLDKLDELVSFELPPSLVQAEADQIAHQLWHEDNPEVQDHNHDAIEPTEEHVKLAERRVRLGLLLAEVGQKNEITVSDQEMTQAVMQQVRQFPGQERAFFEFVQNNQAAQQQLRAPIFEDKVVDHILAAAKITEKTVTKEELEKAVEALDDI